jgi:imidazolonepropionase-like amidohydrolase
MTHCSGLKGLAVAAGAGVDSIEHGFFMDRATLALMRDKDLAWTPTFCPVHFQWAQPDAAGWSAQTVGNLRRILDAHAEHLLMAHRMGVRLLLGTDAGSMGVKHGAAVFEEIERFLEAGLPLAAVLRAATSQPRRHFADPHPLLATGAVFEAVQFAASPFADAQVLRRPQRIWAPSMSAAQPSGH